MRAIIYHFSFLFFLEMISIHIFCQKETNIWYFCNSGLDFNYNPPQVLTNVPWMDDGVRPTSVSTSEGELLFFTNSRTVWNSELDTMENGTGLIYSSYTQSLIFRKPGTDYLYYLFNIITSGDPPNINGLRYAIIDMNANNGLGTVVSKNDSIPYPLIPMLASVTHKNKTDKWVVVHGLNTTAYYSFLLSAEGISQTPVISQIGDYYHWYDNEPMMLKASHDGRLFAAMNADNNYFSIFSFDNLTGHVLEKLVTLQLPEDEVADDFEFSADNSKLYVGFSNKIWQIDLLNNFQISVVGDYYSANLRHLQLSSDGKIYFNYWGIDPIHLGIINFPNLPGTNCETDLDGLFLNGGYTLNIPYFDPAFFNFSFTFNNPCFTESTEFIPKNYQPCDSVHWNFGDPVTGQNNYSSQIESFHIFSGLGSYNVTLTTYLNGFTSVISDSVNIFEKPEVNLGNDTVFCEGDNYLIELSGYSSYLWQDGSTEPSYNITEEGLFWVEVGNAHCTSTDSIYVSFQQFPVIDLGNDTILCEDEALLLELEGYSAYLWQDGSTEAFYNITEEGLYWVEVSNGYCTAIDSIHLQFQPIPSVNLGNDTTITINGSLILNAGSGFETYYWNNELGNQYYTVEGNLFEPGFYSFYVLVNDSLGCMNSDTLVIKIIDDSGIHDISNNSGISISPNPSEGVYKIEINNWPEGEVVAEVYSLNNDLIYSKTFSFQKPDKSYLIIDLTGISQGLYLLKLKNNNIFYSGKIVVK
jgi:hypothetical protein